MPFLLMSGFELIYMDDYIDELLHEERSCDVILPRIQVGQCRDLIGTAKRLLAGY